MKLPPECDALCEWRVCLQPGENKGTYNQGVGYTSYYTTPQPCCMTRLLGGCPDGPIGGRPAPDTAKMVKDLRGQVGEYTCTKKVHRAADRIVDIVRLLGKGYE